MKAKLPTAILALVLLLMFAVTGCFLIPFAGEGSLMIQFPSARSMDPDIVWDTDLDMEIASYTISGSGPLEESFSEEGVTGDTFTEDGLAVGDWEIVIDGYNADGDQVGTVTIETTIRKSQTTTEDADLSPLTGEGVLKISVAWTDSESKMVNPQVRVILRNENGDDITGISDPVELTVDGQTASKTISDLPTGWYEVTVELNEGVPGEYSRGALLTYEAVWDGVYTARIVKDQTTEGSVTVAESLIVFGTGDIEISIGEEMQNPLTVSFEYSPDEVKSGEEITLTSTGSHSASAEYRWYVNGTKVGTGTPAKYTFTETGDFTLALLVLDGGALSGSSQKVTVTEETELGVGDLGPAGGYIFYDDEVGFDFNGDSTIASTEKDLLDGTNDGTVSGDRYLEAAPYGWYTANTDDPALEWGLNSTEVGETSTAVGTGKANTDAIVLKLRPARVVTQTEYAATVCYDYSVTVGETTYDDWFLPSKDELNLIYINLHGEDKGGFASTNYYWSSSEYDSDMAKVWAQIFGIGNSQGIRSKYNSHYIRPVRAF
jgi:plastocyanin